MFEQSQYEGFWLHPAVELRGQVSQRDGGRGVFVSSLAGQPLPEGTLVLAETALLLADSYEDLLHRMKSLQDQSFARTCCANEDYNEERTTRSTDPRPEVDHVVEQLQAEDRLERRQQRKDLVIKEQNLLAAMHPCGFGRFREKIQHNWHSADGMLLEGVVSRTQFRTTNLETEIAKEEELYANSSSGRAEALARSSSPSLLLEGAEGLENCGDEQEGRVVTTRQAVAVEDNEKNRSTTCMDQHSDIKTCSPKKKEALGPGSSEEKLSRSIASTALDSSFEESPGKDGASHQNEDAIPEPLEPYVQHRIAGEEAQKQWSGSCSSTDNPGIDLQQQGSSEGSLEDEIPRLGLWPTASLINHSFAAPNVARSFSLRLCSGRRPPQTKGNTPLRGTIVVEYRVIREIAPGNEVFDNYLDLSSDFKKRKDVELKQHKLRHVRPDEHDNEATREFLAAYDDLWGRVRDNGAANEEGEEVEDDEDEDAAASSSKIKAGAEEVDEHEGLEESAPGEITSSTCDTTKTAGTVLYSTREVLSSFNNDENGDNPTINISGSASAASTSHPSAQERVEALFQLCSEISQLMDMELYSDPAGFHVFLNFAKALNEDGFRAEAVNMLARALDLVLVREPYSLHSCLVLSLLCTWMRGESGINDDTCDDEVLFSPDETESMLRLCRKHFSVVFGPSQFALSNPHLC
ncbi:unnamed protein product [Amoebophrya sp. A25]|nr:unnamed protein product [Amoebophrya sp. A25]|eukprot:GSA25T00004221001.1